MFFYLKYAIWNSKYVFGILNSVFGITNMYTYLEFQIACFKFLNVEFGWRFPGFHIRNMRPDIHLERTEIQTSTYK